MKMVFMGKRCLSWSQGSVHFRMSAWLMLTALIFSLAGCGGSPYVPVTGNVTLDGKAVEGAAVLFIPVAEHHLPATGKTDANGKFTLKTNSADGAMPGDYIVTVTAVKISGVTTEAGGVSGVVSAEGFREEWLVPQIYSSPKTSGLSHPVSKGMQPVQILLKSM